MNSFLKSRAGAVMAGAAVLATLGGVGGAVAAGQIGSSDIRDGSLHSVDLANGSVQSPAILNGTVRKADLSSDLQALLAVPGPKGDTGEKGAKGDTGAAGADGVDGAKGDTGDQGLQGDPGQRGLQGLQGIPGIAGPPGQQGQTGQQGQPGTDGVSGYQRVSSGPQAITASNQSLSVDCPVGTKVLSGGIDGWDDAYVISSFPSDGDTWSVRVGSGTDGTVTVYAVCATVTAVLVP